MSAPAADMNPYVGPHPFQPEQSHLFFGREREASELLSLVIANRIVLFFAQSGAGKTSLLNARLIPELQGKGFEVLPTGRVGGELPSNFAVANIFVFNLMAYLNQGPAGDADLAQLPLSDFLVHLGHVDGKWVYAPAPAEVSAPAGDLPEAAGDADLAIQPRILIVDQFEEILTAHPEAWEQRTDFFVQVRQAMDDDPYLWVLFSMREDFVGALSPYAHLLPDGLRVRYHMQPMDEKAALAAVKQPAALYGHEFAPGVAELLIRNLRQIENQAGGGETRTTKDAAKEEGVPPSTPADGQSDTAAPRLGQFVEPVQLQVVCRQLWESITSPPGMPIGMEDLQKLAGGAGPEEFVNDALRVYYEQSLVLALEHAPDAASEGVSERGLRNWFDQVVITPEGKRNLLHQGEGDTEGMPNEVVKALVDRFILRRETRGDRRWIELAHDRFVEPIRRANRQWFAREPSPTLAWAQLWLNAGKDPTLLLTGDKLAEAAARFKAQPKEFLPLEQEFIEAGEEMARKQAEQRRRVLIAALTASVLTLITIASVIFVMWYNERASRREADASALAAEQAEASAISAKATAESAKATAESAKVTVEAALGDSRMSERWLQADGLAAKSISLLDQPQVALLLAAQASAFQRAAGEEVAPAVEGALHRVLGATGGTVVPLPQAGDGPYAVAIGEDGRVAVDAEPGVVQVWSPADPADAPLRLEGHEGVVRGLAFTPDGMTLVSLDDAGTLRAWELAAGGGAAPKPVVLNAPGEVVWAMALFSDTLAATGTDGGVRIHTLPPGEQPPRAWMDPNVIATFAVFSRDGRYLVTAANDYDQGSLHLWDLAADEPAPGPGTAVVTGTARITDTAPVTGTITPVAAVVGAPVSSLAASPGGDLVAAGRADGTITLYDLPGLDAGAVLRGPQQPVTSLAFVSTPSGLRLAATYAGDSRVYLWDSAGPALGSTAQPTLLRGHTGEIRQLAAGPEDALALVGVGAHGGELRLWDGSSLTYEPQTLAAGLQPIMNVAVAPGGALAAVVYDGEPQAQLVDITGAHAPQPVGGAAADTAANPAAGYATAAAFGADDLLLVSTDQGKLSAWNIAQDTTAAPRWTQAAHTARINDIAVLRAQGLAATAGDDGSVRIWNLQDGTLLAALSPVTPTLLTDVALEPSGGLVAAVGPDGLVHLWDVAARTELPPLQAASAPGAPPGQAQVAADGPAPANFTSLAFGEDGSHLAASRDDGSIAIWDLARRTVDSTPPTGRPVTALASDRRHVIAAHDDGTISLWFVDALDTPPIQLAGHNGRVNDLAVQADGAYLLSAGDDGAVQRWILAVDALVDTACRGAARSLTPAERKLYLSGQPAAGASIDSICGN